MNFGIMLRILLTRICVAGRIVALEPPGPLERGHVRAIQSESDLAIDDAQRSCAGLLDGVPSPK